MREPGEDSARDRGGLLPPAADNRQVKDDPVDHQRQIASEDSREGSDKRGPTDATVGPIATRGMTRHNRTPQSPDAPEDPPGPARVDARGRRRLIEDHLPLVAKICNAICSQERVWNLDTDELLASGHEGLVQVAARFDPTRGVPFEFLARRRIDGAIRDAIRKECRWYAHHPDRKSDGGSDCDPLGAVDGDGRVIPARWNRRPMYQPRHDDPRMELLHRALQELPEKQRRVIELHRLQGKKLKEAAKEMGISSSWACRLDKAAFRALRTALGKEALLLLLPSAGVRQQVRVPDRQERGRRGRRRSPDRPGPTIGKAAGIP